MKEQEDKIEISRLQHSEADKVLSDIQSETEEIYLKNIKFSSDIEEIRSNINDLIAEISSKKSSVSVAENDIIHNEENIKRLENEINQVDIDAVNVNNDIDNKKENIFQIESKILERNKEYEELTEKLNRNSDAKM